MKLRVCHQLEYFIDVGLFIRIVELKAHLQVLEVEYSEVSLRIVLEALDDPGIVDQILLKELRDGVGLREYVEFPLLLEVGEWPSRVHDLLRHLYWNKEINFENELIFYGTEYLF